MVRMEFSVEFMSSEEGRNGFSFPGFNTLLIQSQMMCMLARDFSLIPVAPVCVGTITQWQSRYFPQSQDVIVVSKQSEKMAMLGSSFENGSAKHFEYLAKI